jgi:hypothetical protein
VKTPVKNEVSGLEGMEGTGVRGEAPSLIAGGIEAVVVGEKALPWPEAPLPPVDDPPNGTDVADSVADIEGILALIFPS